MPQAIRSGKSIPKLVRVNAADGETVLYRNLGNGRRLPFIWGTSVTLASGTSEVVVSSGVAFSNHKVCSGVITITPTSSGAAQLAYYIDKDITNNIVKLVNQAGNAGEDMPFDIMFMLGIGYNFDSTHSNQIWK